MTGKDFYQEALKREKWDAEDICDPPTDPRYAVHVLIEHFLGKDYYVVMPENDDQVITAAVADILDLYSVSVFGKRVRFKKLDYLFCFLTFISGIVVSQMCLNDFSWTAFINASLVMLSVFFGARSFSIFPESHKTYKRLHLISLALIYVLWLIR